MSVTFNKQKSRYEINGEPIPLATIHREIQKLLDSTERDLRETGEKLVKEEIAKEDWLDAMKKKVKTAILLATAIAYGGRKQMNVSRWGKAGAAVKEQYKYLNNLFNQIDNARVSDAQIINRSKSYANVIHSVYYQAEKDLMSENFTECRRVQNSKEGCSECDHYASAGWIPIEEQPEIGELICGAFCRCEIEYQ